ncbi:MAG: ComEC/Rec2 family competence protein [Eubacteriales bacterium]|nr:ComEC/Rec2 family competence protein [Eubacteriales bacterium]
MERLLGQIGLTYLSVLAIVFFFGTTCAFVLMGISLVLFIIFMLVKRCRSTVFMPVIACVALLGCVVNVMYTTFVYDTTVNDYASYKGEITAKLKDEPYKYYGNYCYLFNCTSIKGEECDFDFIMYHNDLLNIEPADIITAEVELNKSNNKSNIADGYFLVGEMDYDKAPFTVEKPEYKGVYSYIIGIKSSVREYLRTTLDKDSYELCTALLLGDKYELSDDIRNDFTKAGVSHLVVVSGMHFSVFASVFILLAKKYKRYRMVILSVATLFILFYMMITGMQPSVARSGIMLLVSIVALAVRRDTYPLNSLGLAAIVILCITSPYSAGDIGLILSFATTFSIITVAPIMYRKLYSKLFAQRPVARSTNKAIDYIRPKIRKINIFLLSLFCVNVGAYIVALPLSICFFGAVSALSIISSFVLSYPIELLLLLALLIVLTSFVPYASVVLEWLIQLVTDAVLAVVGFFAELPFSYIYVIYNFVYLWLAFCVVLAIFIYFSKSKNRLKILSLLTVLMLSVGYLHAFYLDSNTVELNVYDVGGGLAVVHSSSDTTAVLTLDCSTSNATKTIRKLEQTVDNIDFASSVADNADSANALKSLTKAFAINDVLLYDTKRTVTLSETTGVVLEPSLYQEVQLADNSVISYYMVKGTYITYLDSEMYSMLILPYGVDVADVPEKFRVADVIVLNSCVENYELLSCDTLIISSNEDFAYYTMKYIYEISNRVLLTAESDVSIILEV